MKNPMIPNTEADKYIYYDKSEGLENSRKFVEKNVADKKLKAYYERIVKVKYALEKGLNEIQRFLFNEYFDGFKLKDVMKYYDLEKMGCSKVRDLRNILAVACFRFLYLVVQNPSASPEQLNLLVLSARNCVSERVVCPEISESVLLSTFLSLDTLNKDVHTILDSRQRGKDLFEIVYELNSEFQEFVGRVSHFELPLRVREILGIN